MKRCSVCSRFVSEAGVCPWCRAKFEKKWKDEENMETTSWSCHRKLGGCGYRGMTKEAQTRCPNCGRSGTRLFDRERKLNRVVLAWIREYGRYHKNIDLRYLSVNELVGLLEERS